MKTQDDDEELRSKLKAAISAYLRIYVQAPAIETATNNIEGQGRLANLLALANAVTDTAINTGIDYDSAFLRTLSKAEIDRRIQAFSEFLDSQDDKVQHSIKVASNYLISDSSKKYLLFYLARLRGLGRF
ncbi:MAG: hypothetical protein ACLQIQ_17650 [Beijerinckiaceae bacterium]